ARSPPPRPGRGPSCPRRGRRRDRSRSARGAGRAPGPSPPCRRRGAPRRRPARAPIRSSRRVPDRRAWRGSATPNPPPPRAAPPPLPETGLVERPERACRERGRKAGAEVRVVVAVVSVSDRGQSQAFLHLADHGEELALAEEAAFARVRDVPRVRQLGRLFLV